MATKISVVANIHVIMLFYRVLLGGYVTFTGGMQVLMKVVFRDIVMSCTSSHKLNAGVLYIQKVRVSFCARHAGLSTAVIIYA